MKSCVFNPDAYELLHGPIETVDFTKKNNVIQFEEKYKIHPKMKMQRKLGLSLMTLGVGSTIGSLFVVELFPLALICLAFGYKMFDMDKIIIV